jgi:MarR family transcriptional regulator, organic hydroperoxide resistance regulator
MVSQPVSQTVSEGFEAVLAPHGIGYRIKLLSQLLARRFQEQLDQFDLTIFHWVVLCCLWKEDGLAISSIGEKLQQVGGTLTGVLDRMESRGLIRRERDLHDRRIWRIWLTEDGRNFESILPPIAMDVREQAMQDLSSSDRERFSDLLNRVIANLS